MVGKKSADVKVQVNDVSFDASLSDIHPKHKRDADGREEKWIELKLTTGRYDPRLVTQLLTMHGSTCVISMQKQQGDLGIEEGVGAGA